jgi:transposase InsO family protein
MVASRSRHVYGENFRRRTAGLGITEVVSALASPWQNLYAERAIGSSRRECLDHVIVLDQAHLRRVLTIYSRYDHRSRTHLGFEKDAPPPFTVRIFNQDVKESTLFAGITTAGRSLPSVDRAFRAYADGVFSRDRLSTAAAEHEPC